MSKRLIYLVVDNHCVLCMEAILESSQIDDQVLIIDRKLLELIEEEPDDILFALKDLAKNWHKVGEKFIIKLKSGQKVSEYKDTTKVVEIKDVVPYLMSFGDDEYEERFGSLAVDYIKKRSGNGELEE